MPASPRRIASAARIGRYPRSDSGVTAKVTLPRGRRGGAFRKQAQLLEQAAGDVAIVFSGTVDPADQAAHCFAVNATGELAPGVGDLREGLEHRGAHQGRGLVGGEEPEIVLEPKYAVLAQLAVGAEYPLAASTVRSARAL